MKGHVCKLSINYTKRIPIVWFIHMFRTLQIGVNFTYSNHSIHQDSAHLIWQKFDSKHALASEWSSC